MDTRDIYEQIAEQYAEKVKTKPFNAYLERPDLSLWANKLDPSRVRRCVP
jgi:hypothetical protein